MMRSVSLSIILLLVFASNAIAKDKSITVLTSLEVTTALAEALTRGTSIRVINVIPDGYSMRGQDAYLKKHQASFFEKAREADAVLTVGAAWPADPLYKWARRGNIRIVNIDVSKPLDEYGAGVPLLEVAGKYSPYVWRSPANLTRMASIASDDLCRLTPGDATRIKANLQEVQSVLFRLRSKYEAASLDLAAVELAAFTTGYTYLINEFGLEVMEYFLRSESAWSDSDMERMIAQIKGAGVKAVVCPWEPDAKGRHVIERGGAVPVVLQAFKRAEEENPVDALIGWYEGNLSRLINALHN
ncbi:putative Periplasmic solute binding protein [Pseudodesulfovibrio profundus]|uniref:Putative Periplasmic solute binding protein n=1 Tax=Pseudodesulfovibrio profundus TaxID=57320 RepID=A0A2C8FCD4_9BACT|nr:zinc ABC transporter substrate-binding protein [Pseudodesulfovibrio profundus]SOB60111.1 putative Periplasmic solute binding protein [Pseudodesulfovibrio profundus]